MGDTAQENEEPQLAKSVHTLLGVMSERLAISNYRVKHSWIKVVNKENLVLLVQVLPSSREAYDIEPKDTYLEFRLEEGQPYNEEWDARIKYYLNGGVNRKYVIVSFENLYNLTLRCLQNYEFLRTKLHKVADDSNIDFLVNDSVGIG